MPFEAYAAVPLPGRRQGRLRGRRAARSGSTEPYSPMGANFGDFDNDGFLDFYAAAPGCPRRATSCRTRRYHNRRRQDASPTSPCASGLGNLQKGHGVAFADFDSDGDLDVFAQMGGAFRADHVPQRALREPGLRQRTGCRCKLEGTSSNRSRDGRAHPRRDRRGRRRSARSTAGSGAAAASARTRCASTSASARRDQDRASVEVFWPKTGKTQIVQGPP